MQTTDGHTQLLGIPAAMAAPHGTCSSVSIIKRCYYVHYHYCYGWTCRPQMDIPSFRGFLQPWQLHMKRRSQTVTADGHADVPSLFFGQFRVS